MWKRWSFPRAYEPRQRREAVIFTVAQKKNITQLGVIKGDVLSWTSEMPARRRRARRELRRQSLLFRISRMRGVSQERRRGTRERN